MTKKRAMQKQTYHAKVTSYFIARYKEAYGIFHSFDWKHEQPIKQYQTYHHAKDAYLNALARFS